MTAPTTPVAARSILGDLAYLLAMAAIAVLAAWPIYQSPAYVIMASVTVVVAIGVVVLARARRWSGWIVAAILAGFFLVAGVPLAVPSALVGIEQFLGGFVQLLSGIVVGWKELLTISIPAGSYRATLVPAFVILLVGVAVATWFAVRPGSIRVVAVPILVAVQGFGLAFGSSLASDAMSVGPLDVVAPRETLLSMASFGASVAWLIWRAWLARSAALAAAQRSSGVRNLAHGRASAVRRALLAVAMIGVAVFAATAITPALAAGRTRDVLRSTVDPALTVRTELSPLSTYRQYFDDDVYGSTLFTVTAPAEVERVRLATLSVYDGQVFRVGAATTTADPASSFARVPYTLIPGSDGERADVALAIDAYDAVWVPTAGDLVSVAFDGDRRQALADGFFYNQQLAAGIELATGGLEQGDEYTLTTVVPSATPLVDLSPLTEGPTEADAAVIPESLVDWVEQQKAPAGAAGLQTLIDRLRARGLLSHSLESGGEEAQHLWVADLEPYTFAPSLAGHSTDRIGALFTALLDKQADVGGEDDSQLIAAVGDDEQFAVAGALLARQLGFDSRVVIGVRLASSDAVGVPTCADGVCTGGDLAAWIEVRGADGRWATVDVTPQHTAAVSPDIDRQSDPQVPTEVTPVNAEAVLPAEGIPGDGDNSGDDPEPPGIDLGWLWTTLRIIGIVLLVLLVLAGPIIVIAAAKWFRRRGRRADPDPAQRITGGWDEYVDTALDHGLPIAHNVTRTELAALHASTDAAVLADRADRAVFHWLPPEEAESEEFWAIVDAERARLGEGLTWRERLKALLSLRSFTHRVDLRMLVPGSRGKTAPER